MTTTNDVKRLVQAVTKRHGIKIAKLVVTAATVRFDFAPIFDSVTAAGKKQLKLARSIGKPGHWSEERFKAQLRVARRDGVFVRQEKTIREIAKELKKLGVSYFGHVLPKEGTAGFGGYGVENIFKMHSVATLSIGKSWFEYPIYKVIL